MEGPFGFTWSASAQPDEATDERALRLPAGLAEGMRQILHSGWEAKKGFDAASAARDGLIVVLQPSPETAKGLAKKTLNYTTKRQGGGVFAQVRDAKTGAVVENVTHLPSGSTTATAAMAAAGGFAVAWKVMAIATQQHYLTEISGRLGRLESSIAHLIERDLADKEARLRTISENVDLFQRHLDSDAQLTHDDRRTAMQYFSEAREIWVSEITLAERGAASLDRAPVDVIGDLWLADLALSTLALCALMVLQLPFDDDRRRLDALEHYAEIIDGAAIRTDAAAKELSTAADAIAEDWRLHEHARSTAQHNVRLAAPLLAAAPVAGVVGVAAVQGVRRLRGRPSTKFELMELRRLRRPGRPHVDEDHLDWIHTRAGQATLNRQLPAVAIRIEPNGDVHGLPGTPSAVERDAAG